MHQYSWSGLLVEPLPDLFARLQHTYRNAQGLIRFANVAITDPEQECEMIRVPPEVVDAGDAPDWALGVSSFFESRSAVGGVGASRQDFETYVEKLERTRVMCVTLPDLLEQYEVAKIDWFQVRACMRACTFESVSAHGRAHPTLVAVGALFKTANRFRGGRGGRNMIMTEHTSRRWTQRGTMRAF